MSDDVKECPRAKSSMTPCVLRDGDVAKLEGGSCVGCGWKDPYLPTEADMNAQERKARAKIQALEKELAALKERFARLEESYVRVVERDGMRMGALRAENEKLRERLGRP